MYLSLIFAVTKHGSHFQRKKCTRSVIHPLLTLQTETLDEHRRLHTSSLIHKGINIMMKFLSTRQTRPRSVNIPLPIRVTKCQWKTGWSSNEHVGNLSPPPPSVLYLRPLPSFAAHKSGGRTREKLAFTTSSSSPLDRKGAIVALICMTEG